MTKKKDIDYGKIAAGLGADRMIALEETGLEVIFSTELTRHSTSVSSSGAVFFYEFLESYDLEKKRIVLRIDFHFGFKKTGKAMIVFYSLLPNSPFIWANSEIIVSIKDTRTDKLLYPIEP